MFLNVMAFLNKYLRGNVYGGVYSVPVVRSEGYLLVEFRLKGGTL